MKFVIERIEHFNFLNLPTSYSAFWQDGGAALPQHMRFIANDKTIVDVKEKVIRHYPHAVCVYEPPESSAAISEAEKILRDAA